MSDLHLAFWPKSQPHHLTVPQTSLLYNMEVSATRFPDKQFLIFYDTPLTFSEFKDGVERIAGFLEQECGIVKGDRVLLYMQNSPQFILAYYGILRANAVVVPINPMNLTNELRHYVDDSGAHTAFVPQDLYCHIEPLVGQGIKHVVVAAYADYVHSATDLTLPAFIAAPRQEIIADGVVLWNDMMERHLRPGKLTVGSDDLAVMPYTSGTTGHPKGCMHTHKSVMYNVLSGIQWLSSQQDSVVLSVLPFFHVTGMLGGMHGPLYVGSTVVLLPRWDRDAAAEFIKRYKVNGVQLISTMVVDLLSSPNIDQYELSSLTRISGGGAAMPEAIAQKFNDLLGVPYLEGYGMSETISATHINPPERPKKQCLGIPIYDVDARVVDPETMRELPPGEVGEIIVHGPQLMRGYWNNAAATAEVFVDIDGKRFLRTGDLALVDEDGYFFMKDRLKRMINAAGFKIWPAEVEALMYQHPAIQEVCVIAKRDTRRGETVKAVIVLKAAFRNNVSEQDIIDWAHLNMATYKCPRSVEFCDALPKSATGKLLWRKLQDNEADGA